MKTLRLSAWAVFLIAPIAMAQESRKNILFLAADDLRPQLACYGFSGMKTPHLDALAARGTVFQNAYCQSSTCRASRLSLLTGRRPDTTKIYTNGGALFRTKNPQWVTLPQHFKNNGWHSQSLGKIFHGAFEVRKKWNDPKSWSVPEWWPEPRYYYTPEGIAAARAVFEKKRPNKNTPIDDWVNHFVLGLSYEAPEVADNVLYDGALADKAIATLNELKDRPFFLGVGFIRPHLPFIAPKKYWDLYPPESITVADNQYPPKDSPPYAMTPWGHPRTYTDFPNKGNPSPELVLNLTRGYAACVSYVDAQVGRILGELDRLGLRDNTVIVFWGDHGFHLGENATWGKTTNFEMGTRVPLIVSAPGMKSAGQPSKALVELVDLYPTLSELAGLPISDELEGSSFVPVLNDPETTWKKAAFSQFPRGPVMGHSMRTDRLRFTQWKHQKTGKIMALELYDQLNDPDNNVNLANREEHAEVVEELTAQLEKGWRDLE